jgi:hypothetical protein
VTRFVTQQSAVTQQMQLGKKSWRSGAEVGRSSPVKWGGTGMNIEDGAKE